MLHLGPIWGLYNANGQTYTHKIHNKTNCVFPKTRYKVQVHFILYFNITIIQFSCLKIRLKRYADFPRPADDELVLLLQICDNEIVGLSERK